MSENSQIRELSRRFFCAIIYTCYFFIVSANPANSTGTPLLIDSVKEDVVREIL